MHVFWAYDDCFLDDDVTAKNGPEELLKGGCENGKLLICQNWAGIMFKGRLLAAAMKLILLAATYGCGPYIFEVIDGERL